MIEQAAILVGGLGTRLGALTANTPKPLLPCGDRPFLAWVIEGLAALGVDRVLLLAGYRAEAVEAALPCLASVTGHRVALQMVREPQPLGTGGALWHARDRLDGAFLLCNGDSWFDADLSGMLGRFAADPPAVVGRMVLRRMADASRYGVAEVEGDVVCGFRDRPPEPASTGGAPPVPRPGLINAGIYALRRTVLDWLEEASMPCSLERDVLPALARGGVLRASIPADGYFIDIGVPEDFRRAQTELPQRFRAGAVSRSGCRPE